VPGHQPLAVLRQQHGAVRRAVGVMSSVDTNTAQHSAACWGRCARLNAASRHMRMRLARMWWWCCRAAWTQTRLRPALVGRRRRDGLGVCVRARLVAPPAETCGLRLIDCKTLCCRGTSRWTRIHLTDCDACVVCV
jgi:hypothetical protein